MMPSSVPMIRGIGVNSRIRVRAGMYGLKFAASGFSGLYPTISGISLGGFLRSIFAIPIYESPDQSPNESRGSRRSRRSHAQDPSIKQERCDCEGDAADENCSGSEVGPDQRERRAFPGEDNDGRERYADNAFADDQSRCE